MFEAQPTAQLLRGKNRSYYSYKQSFAVLHQKCVSQQNKQWVGSNVYKNSTIDFVPIGSLSNLEQNL